MNANPLDSVQQELVWERNYGDGLNYISSGLFGILIGLILYFQSPHLILITIPLLLLTPFIRKRYIYPRIGQVKLINKLNYYHVAIGIGVMLLLLVEIWMIKRSLSTPWLKLWVVIGIATFFSVRMFTIVITWNGKNSYPFIDGIMILALLLLLLWMEPSLRTLIVFLGVYGVFNLLFGLATYASFIKRNPVLPNEE